jgi:mono/diheme cytochrome c family protein
MRAVMLLALLALLAAPALAEDSRVQRGRAFVESHCATCHAIGPTGDSPHAEAPAFRTLRERYPIEDLAESLAEGIMTGHPSMPEFQLAPSQINDVIAYLNSIQNR